MIKWGIYKNTAFEREKIFEDFIRGFKNSLQNCPIKEKLQKLKHISENYKFNCLISYKSRRRFHNEYKGQWFKDWKICFVCKKNNVEHIHHIVMLFNGGTNDESNLIGICKLCHSKIHLWLNKQKEKLR